MREERQKKVQRWYGRINDEWNLERLKESQKGENKQVGSLIRETDANTKVSSFHQFYLLYSSFV